MLVERHFAFYRQGTGEWVRDWKGLVPAPAIPARVWGWWPWPGWRSLTAAERDARLTAWQHAVAPPDANEVGLDVTHFGWPAGDFIGTWFDEAARFLDWGPPHYFLEIDLATMAIVANTQSHRPVRPPAGRVILDITGTPWEALHGRLFGTLVRHGDRWQLAATTRALPLDLINPLAWQPHVAPVEALAA